MATNIYIKLTKLFNADKLRAILSSGQAVVLHRLAMMSKDGDWVLRADQESLTYVLGVLSEFGATYRFGAPLDLRWLSHGWSAHLEFINEGMRVRTDFVVTPPRITTAGLERMWHEQEGAEIPFVGLRDLADLKKTNREKDYPVIGELARRMTLPRDTFMYSRSARDLIALATKHPELLTPCTAERPALKEIAHGEARLAAALDAERRDLMRVNEERLAKYLDASRPWQSAWPAIQSEIAGLPLSTAHAALIKAAEGTLPFSPGE